MIYDITIKKADQSRIKDVDFDNIPFGRIFSDHMFIADYYDGDWHDCRIVPFGKIPIHPATSSLHYGQSIFEGLKAYKNVEDGTPQIFRPEKNVERMARSADRMGMPAVPASLFLDALKKLVNLDKEWIPTGEGASLYIRPFMFATDEYIGIKPADNFKFVIFACPVQAYYSKPVRVLITDRFVRAFPGGTGAVKAAGNYAATLYPVKLAHQAGFDQILWTDAYEFKYMQEIGTMNVFFIIGDEVITPPLEEGTILEGVTRDSVITLLKNKGIQVSERRISVDEITEAYEKGQLKDAFGTGTAATLSHIAAIGYKDRVMDLPPIEQRTISVEVKEELDNIKIARIPDPFGWMLKVETSDVVVDG